MSEAVHRVDAAVDHWFDHIRGKPGADRLFYSLSELGNFSLIWYIVGTTKSLAYRDPTKELLELAAVIGTESILVNQGIKRLFNRKRPDNDEPHPRAIRQPITSSFPSGHASAAFTSAAVLSDGSRLRPVYYGLAVAMSISRIYTRMHHASDVAGGVACGMVLGHLANRALRHVNHLPSEP